MEIDELSCAKRGAEDVLERLARDYGQGNLIILPKNGTDVQKELTLAFVRAIQEHAAATHG